MVPAAGCGCGWGPLLRALGSISTLSETESNLVAGDVACACREKVTVPAGKPFVTFQGAGLWNTEIVWHNTASDVDDFGRPLSAYNSATVSVFASNFVARNISFKVC